MRVLQVLASIGLASAACAVSAGEHFATGSGPLQASASIDVKIVVPPTLEMRLLDHPATVEVTASDAANGEVVVSGPRLALIANGRRGYYVQAELSPPFSEALIDGLAKPVLIRAADVARVLMPSMVGAPRPAPYPVSYHLRLAKGTAPGVYHWPVALSLESP